MNEQPLAEAFEKLKELRRRGDLESELQSGLQLRALQDEAVRTGAADVLPGHFGPADLVRVLDIQTLAERVFGDREKAGAWLARPNTALSGQKPIDLLKDELGAVVVRETLEQIDSGIFA
jgi:hypothetical protein